MEEGGGGGGGSGGGGGWGGGEGGGGGGGGGGGRGRERGREGERERERESLTAVCPSLCSLLGQLKPGWTCDCEEKVKEFSATLTLVTIPPPGHLHVVSTTHTHHTKS